MPSYIELKEDLKLAMKTKNMNKRDTLRVILGELSRLNNKEATDEEVVKVLRKLQKNEKLVIGQGKPTVFLEIVESYLPKQMSKDEIMEYVSTVDLTGFKNKLQAIGVIVKGLKGNASGQDVKEVLLNLE